MKARRVWHSLRFRLLAGTLLAVCLSLLAAFAVLSSLFSEHASRQFEVQLQQQLDHLTSRVEFDQAGRPSIDGATLADPRWQAPYSGLYGQIDGAGEVARWRSRSLWDAVLDVRPDLLSEGQLHAHAAVGPRREPLLMLERRLRPAGYADAATWRLVVAADRRGLDEAIVSFRDALAMSLAALAVLLLLAATLQALLLLRPLQRLHGALAAIESGSATRLRGDFPAELQPMIERFNGVLDQHEELVARARRNAGNLAHALKTPLTVLDQAARQEATDLAKQVLAQSAIARRHIDWHLFRARADAAGNFPGQRTPVTPVVQGLLRVMSRAYAERALSFSFDPPMEDTAFAGEEQDLQEILGNLLDNAAKWAHHSVCVRVDRAGSDAGNRLCIRVEDDGPGIADEARERALARGIRLDEAVAGSGLGLAIVSDLVRSYRGELHLERSVAGGLCARLCLPLAAGRKLSG